MRTSYVAAGRGRAWNAGDALDAAGATWRELLALLRIAAFRRVAAVEIVGRESTLVTLAAIALAAWIAVDPLVHSREMVFTWYAVPDVLCIVTGLLAVTWLLSRLSRPCPGYRRTLLVALGTLPLLMIGAVGSWKLVNPWVPLLSAALSLYALAFVSHGLRALTGAWQHRAVLAAALVAGGFIWSLDYLQVNPRLWVRADEKADRLNPAGVDSARMSRVQFTQQARIDATIAAMAPQTPGVVETYFVGFAGYGEEPIFSREIALAEQVVGSRFGSERRSLRLVNDRRDVESWPIATEPGLRHALRRMGEVMGDEDVLFLVFSSHGDRGKGVRVTNPGMMSGTLAPGTVEEMLRDAGIDWRVVVVSACYSGPFVDTLANDRTIVIAAASADRKSFGCNDSREITYFGEAFFRDALAGGGSLHAAFDTARVALERKERASGITPSLPRAAFGTQLEGRLQEARTAAR